MKKYSIFGGLVGAAALTLLHQTVKQFDSKAPRMDLLGMMALSKMLRALGLRVPRSSSLYIITMLGDVASNALYYSLAGAGKKGTLAKGAALGLAAGAGALLLPKPLHLNPAYSNRTPQTQWLTVAYYVVGSMVAAAVIKKMAK